MLCEWYFSDTANVFGKPKTNTNFLPYNGDGFKLQIPSKWNPSKEVEFPGQVLRYEDNFDTTSNLVVTVTPTNKKSITDYGSPEQFLSQVVISLSQLVVFTLINWNWKSFVRPQLIKALICHFRAGGLSARKTSLLWQNWFRGKLFS